MLAALVLTELLVVILVFGVIALRRCDPEHIPETLRALSRFVGHPDHQAPKPLEQPGTPAKPSGRHVSVRNSKP